MTFLAFSDKFHDFLSTLNHIFQIAFLNFRTFKAVRVLYYMGVLIKW